MLVGENNDVNEETSQEINKEWNKVQWEAFKVAQNTDYDYADYWQTDSQFT